MEHVGVAPEAIWNSFGAAAVPPSTLESDMMMMQLLDSHCSAYEQEQESIEAMAAILLPSLDTGSNSSGCVNYDAYPQYWPQPSYSAATDMSTDGFLPPAEDYESCEFSAPNLLPSAGLEQHCTVPSLNEEFSHLCGNHEAVMSPAAVVNQNSPSMKSKFDMEDDEKPVTNKRKSRAAAVPASRKSRKGEKSDCFGDDEDRNGNFDTQSSSCCTSEEEVNLDGNAGSSSKKTATRASRGAATDPQSLYARKRRERINERLKTLQDLVPNGTKVDISTMLEEAVQYVKFLQLQIKLLSSDDLWMYAPIAYNGVNISNVDLNISPLLQ